MKRLALLLLALSLSATGCDTASVDQTVIQSSNNQSEPSAFPKEKIPEISTPEPIPAPKPRPSLKQQSSCDPNYSGCVPIASDVDCAGGSGDGPAYTGRVNVTGTDIHGLDRDGDGIACE